MTWALPAPSAFKRGCVLMSDWDVLLRCFFLTPCVLHKSWVGVCLHGQGTPALSPR